jgi:hypothetical protein
MEPRVLSVAEVGILMVCVLVVGMLVGAAINNLTTNQAHLKRIAECQNDLQNLTLDNIQLEEELTFLRNTCSI